MFMNHCAFNCENCYRINQEALGKIGFNYISINSGGSGNGRFCGIRGHCRDN